MSVCGYIAYKQLFCKVAAALWAFSPVLVSWGMLGPSVMDQGQRAEVWCGAVDVDRT
jgi:hypothetical protein